MATLGWLPEQLRRYVQRALPDDPPSGSYVRISQKGDMTLKQGARPRPFIATEELAIREVEFSWHARFKLIGPFSLYAVDSYEHGVGQLSIRFSGLRPRRRRGPELSEGEALRYLAEIPWVPHAIIGNPQLEWRSVDDRTVEVATSVAAKRVSVRHVFDEAGDIVRASGVRPRGDVGNVPTPWIGEFRDHRDFGGVRVPAYGEVAWDLPEGPFTYWRGTITSLELDR